MYRKLSVVALVFSFALFSGTIEEEAHRFEFIGEPVDSTIIMDYLARYNIPFTLQRLMESSKTTGKKLYILVDMDIYPDISDAVSQYISDLETDGYEITLWGIFGGTPEDIRGLLQSGYDNGIEGAVLIGDIIARLSAIEISLFESVYPCDLYYEDLDGEWTVDTIYGYLIDHTDGSGDVAPEIYIGRILPKRSAGNDSVLINNYFDRIHNLRLGNYSIERGYRALGFFDDDWAGWTSHQPDKWRIHDDQVKQGFSHRDIWATPWGAIEDTTIRDYYAGKNTLYAQLENQYE